MKTSLDSLKQKLLAKDFFPSLIKIESAFHLKMLDVSLLQTLVNKYATLVEFYDLTKDPIKQYFLDKIQFVLSRPEAIRTLVQIDCHDMENFLKQSIQNFDNLSRQPSLIEIVDKNNALRNLKQSVTNKQRSQQVNLNVEIEKQKQLKAHSFNRIIENFASEQQEMDTYIQNQMCEQEILLQDKLLKRKLKLKTTNELHRIQSESEFSCATPNKITP